ncbi:MAP7 domain-containing protein 1 [Drosophila mojavensis]|uniref:Uncharacterized protein n=1 Tax=Drosophila mojavensis TaxID=7230 RepID=B4KMI8_DROMO|nr:MAP7 domain-containing protein 1 [Drosophila mojavensis]EDW10835.2 uncharacterized protein Dmoj_GI21323 [Drosophila mojavensis]
MGCSNSKSTTAVDETRTKATPAPAPAPSLPPAAPPRETTSSNTMDALPKQDYPPSEAFTIPLDDAASDTVPLNDTLRQPPKRLQQLMQQAAEAEPLTLDELEDKQQRAETRRQELMHQKLEAIQKNTQMLMQRGQTTDEEQPRNEHQQPEQRDDLRS